MTIDNARKWLIASSLVITGVQMVFLLVAPVIGFPLPYPKNLDLLQIVSPVFLGYLGSASHFIFQNPVPAVPVQNQYLGLLLKGPLVIYILAAGGSLAAFGYSNRVGSSVGAGMSVDNLGTALSLSLGVLAVTTGVLSSYLFVTPNGLHGPQTAQQGTGRAKGSPKPWNWVQTHEIGCRYPVGENGQFKSHLIKA